MVLDWTLKSVGLNVTSTDWLAPGLSVRDEGEIENLELLNY